jgi:hypothetical protein
MSIRYGGFGRLGVAKLTKLCVMMVVVTLALSVVPLDNDWEMIGPGV